jgi:8-oxo-dGTP pyrophosphatase MutT (NUDIX family)
MQHIDKLALIEIQDRKILMVRSKGKDTWYIPGGKRDEGESDEEALIREIKEELGADLLPDTISFYAEYEAQAHGKEVGVMVRAKCYTAKYLGDFQASSEIEEFAWFDYSKKEIVGDLAKLIFEDLKLKDLID